MLLSLLNWWGKTLKASGRVAHGENVMMVGKRLSEAIWGGRKMLIGKIVKSSC